MILQKELEEKKEQWQREHSERETGKKRPEDSWSGWLNTVKQRPSALKRRPVWWDKLSGRRKRKTFTWIMRNCRWHMSQEKFIVFTPSGDGKSQISPRRTGEAQSFTPWTKPEAWNWSQVAWWTTPAEGHPSKILWGAASHTEMQPGDLCCWSPGGVWGEKSS